MDEPTDPLPRISVTRSYDAFADVLRQRIVSGALPPGTTLPGERDLVAQTGLGRGSVREAIRKLEAEGLLKTRPGRYGGTVVQPGGTDAIGRMVDVFIQGRRIPFTTLLQTRRAIEPSLAALAAAHHTEAQLETIERVGEELEAAWRSRRSEMSRINVEWHLAVADASGNDLLAAFMHSIATACLRAGALEDYGSDVICRGLLHAHAGIAAAIRARDMDAARRRMTRHLDAYDRELGNRAPQEVAVGPHSNQARSSLIRARGAAQRSASGPARDKPRDQLRLPPTAWRPGRLLKNSAQQRCRAPPASRQPP